MSELAGMFAKAYRSKRLIYRDIENSDADKELMYKYGPANHATWGLLSGRLFKDVNMKSNSELLGKILESGLLLKVLICLPAPEEVLGDMSKLGPGDRGAKERQAAIPIGSLTLSLPSESFLHAPTTAVGLAIGEEFQSKGYGSEAINWAVDWAFRFANMHKVEISTQSFNDRAMHLYQKIGFSFEGRKREVMYVDCKYYDLVEFGMLRSEWEKLRGVE